MENVSGWMDVIQNPHPPTPHMGDRALPGHLMAFGPLNPSVPWVTFSHPLKNETQVTENIEEWMGGQTEFKTPLPPPTLTPHMLYSLGL